MRIRAAVAVATVLLATPALTFAQARVPRIGARVPGTAVPLSPQPEAIARSLAYQRSRYSVETYPLLSRVQAPGFSAGNGVSSWTSYGSGTRLDYRSTQVLSVTFDLTSSLLGGPSISETAELGVRLHPEDWERTVRPYADLRVGFVHSFDTFESPAAFSPNSLYAMGSRYSRGFGSVVGGGLEYSLTNTLALTTGVSAMRSHLVAYRFSGASLPAGDAYDMTTYRLTLGLTYNPVHLLHLADSNVP